MLQLRAGLHNGHGEYLVFHVLLHRQAYWLMLTHTVGIQRGGSWIPILRDKIYFLQKHLILLVDRM